MRTFRQWCYRYIALPLLGVGLLLVISQLILFALLRSNMLRHQDAFGQRFVVASREALSLHQQNFLDQLGAIATNEIMARSVVLCDAAEHALWSFPVYTDNCRVRPLDGYRVVSHAVFPEQDFPRVFLQVPNALPRGITAALITSVGMIICLGVLLLSIIAARTRKDLYNCVRRFHDNSYSISIRELEQIRSELWRLREEEQRMAASAAMGQMALQIAHDMRSPLTSVQVAGRIIQEESSGTRRADALDLLQLGSRRLEEIANELLNQHQHSASTRQASVAPAASSQLQELCDALVGELRAQPLAAGVIFEKKYPVAPIVVAAGRVALQRAVGNIIKNSLEAMQSHARANGVENTSSSLTITLTTEEPWAIVRIADTGPGMSPDLLQKILRGGHTEGKVDGHGIGMQVVRDVLAACHGLLECESTVGVGTSFCLKVPLSAAAVSTATVLSPCNDTGVRAGAGPGGYRVLLIDDDRGVRSAWKLLRTSLGIHELAAFPSMEECVSGQLDYAAFDFAFIDKHIPNSIWQVNAVIAHLKSAGVGRVYVASGETAEQLQADPDCAQADGIVAGKIPKDLATLCRPATS